MRKSVRAVELLPRVRSAFQEAFPDLELEVREVPVNDVVISLPASHVLQAIHLLVEQFGIVHLSTITGDHRGDDIWLLFHFWDGCGVTLETRLPAAEPRMQTLTALMPGASFYEREVFEMFGVVFEGHPDLRPLLLPDDWDAGPPLLRSSSPDTESQS